MSATGKTSGGMTLAGWRDVRTIERRAIAPTRGRLLTADPLLLLRLGLLRRALEGAPRLGEEDVVEGRRAKLEIGDVHAVLVDRAHDVGEPEPVP